MIEITDVAEGILSGYSYRVYHRLQSVYEGQVVAEDIPAVDVLEEIDATVRVPERLTFKVPIWDDLGNLWVPLSYDAPLGAWGQRIISQVGVGVGNGEIEWINRGTFVLWSAATEGQSINVECLGLMALLDQAQLPNEYQPKASATLGSILRAMVEPGITVDLDNAPTDRTTPSGITWSDNRLDNVYNVLDAWPAQGKITEEGYLEILAVPGDPVAADVVFAFNDGATGTVVEWSTSITREGAFNGVVAKGQYPDTAGAKAGQEIIATAYDNDPESPFRVGGPFSPYLVPYGYASPLLTTPAQVASAGSTRMQTLRRTASRTVQITAVPHPALQDGDPVSVASERLGLSATLGRIEAMTLPHTAEGGAMSVTVRLVD